MTMHPSADLIRKAESFAEICICTATRMIRGCPRHCPGETPDLESARHLLHHIIEQQEKIMTAQDDINVAVTAIQAVTADLTGAASNIQAEVASLNAQIAAAGGTPVDTTALNAAIAPLQAAQKAVDALETPATPTPATGTAGSTTPPPAAPVASDTGTTTSAS